MRPAGRTYLRAGARRRQLLDAAWRCALRDGLGQITMAAVAREAGVSRQLLYTRFAGLPALARELLIDRFAQRRGAIDQAIANRAPGAERPALVAAGVLFALPGAERRVFQSFLALASVPGHPLAQLAREARGELIERWGALAGRPLDAGTRGAVWALISAVFGLAELIDAGELSREQALAQVVKLLECLFPAGGRDE